MYKLIEANKRNTILIMIGFVAIITAISCLFAYAYGDWSIAWIVLIIAAIYATIQYFLASSLAVAMTGAKKIERKDNRRLYDIVENLSIVASVPTPKVYIIDDPAPNAFATGRDPAHSLIAVTTGLLDIMNDNELSAVVAHEMSHIKNYDIRLSMITFGLVCLIGYIADIGFRMMYFSNNSRDSEDRSLVGVIVVLITSILAPIAAAIAQMAVSREREYLADVSAVKLTASPDDMISALKKLDTHTRPMKRQNSATEAMFISSPLRKGVISNLFSTHPPIEKRIERLEHGI